MDVSADGGHTWTEAYLRRNGQEPHKTWAWTLWDAYVPLPTHTADTKHVELVVKAVDMAYNTQPDHVDALWNKEGVLNNSWHRVRLHVKK